MSDPSDIGSMVQGGGLLAFAAAVWYAIREVKQILQRAIALLERLDERTAIEFQPPPSPVPSSPRRRVRTAPRGYPVRPAAGDDDETEPGGGRRG